MQQNKMQQKMQQNETQQNETQYNFDKIIDRRGTDSLKHDYAKELGKPESATPLWVADMDFEIPPEATKAIMNSANHAIYGYTITKDDYTSVVQAWFRNNFGFESEPEWIVKTPGVIFALAMAVRAFTNEGDKIIIQKPVYHPFEQIVKVNNRVVINNPLIHKNSEYNNSHNSRHNSHNSHYNSRHNNRYSIDFEDFERKIADNNVKMFILCSPHNPVSRVWTKEELYEMGKICLKHKCLVVSDEIHCDLVYEGYKHHNFATVCGSFLENSIICTSPSKTFNLSGLQNSNIFIPNEKLRQKFATEISKAGYHQMSTMGLAACKAVYQHGHGWLSELLNYLQGNIKFMKAFLEENMPQVKLTEPEGTYLLWLDFNGLNLSRNLSGSLSRNLFHEELDDIFLNKAGVWFSSGTGFGEDGRGFFRVNIACPRSTLEDAMKRIVASL